jgi:Integrase core domain
MRLKGKPVCMTGRHARTRCRRVPLLSLRTKIVALRGAERRGQDWIADQLGVAARTVSRVLRRHNVPYLRDCDPITGEVIRASKAIAVRYERARPGELVHMDVKKLGRIPDGGGWRAHGRAGRDGHLRLGFDYVHSLVDDHSRFAYSETLADEKATTCAAFLTRAAAFFRAHGIDRIEQVMTDNAWAPTTTLCAGCAPNSTPAKCSSNPTAPGRTAKSSDSIEHCNQSGPTGRSSSATPSAQQHLHLGCSTTTLDDATAQSAASHPSAACYQPDGRVHLVAGDFAFAAPFQHDCGDHQLRLRHGRPPTRSRGANYVARQLPTMF